MSYDIRIGVKVAGAEEVYAVIAVPEYSSPTYNLGEMFRKCTGWDFKQGEWYKAKDVIQLIDHGRIELILHENDYKKYEDPDGWGTAKQARNVLEGLLDCIIEQNSGTWAENQIPLDCMYVKW